MVRLLSDSLLARNIKYVIIPIIALGIGLSLIFGIEYTCTPIGERGMMPKYYGHPFTFKYESLATSLEYYYNLTGVILNTVFWSLFVIFIRFLVLKLIKWSGDNRGVILTYRILISLCLFITTMILLWTMVETDNLDNIDLYWSMTKEAEEWNCTCQGRFMILKE